MGRQEIEEFLEQNPGKKFTSGDLAKHLGSSYHTLNRALRGMKKSGFIQWEFIKVGRGYFKYWVR